MDHCTSIDRGISENQSHRMIARKIYLTTPTFAFIGKEEKQYDILNEISEKLRIPLTTIHVVGSAKTGKSFHQKTDFIPGTSDLDIAIVDSQLFTKYLDIAFRISEGYSNKTKFPVNVNGSTYKEFVVNISKGIFRPDLMPHCFQRADWWRFFGRLSAKHTDLFSSINAGIYLSQTCFEYKQMSSITNYVEGKKP